MQYTPLLTDLYQLTMGDGYFRLNKHEQEAVFHLYFRHNPFHGNYALNCGLTSVIEFLQQWHFTEEDLAYLATLKNAYQKPLFSADFLDYLCQLTFSCDIDAIPEGAIVFPQVPLLRIQGPLLQCQLLETPLLNFLNFQTLIATKASRVCRAARGDTVIEFGMRRAQGPDGALAASRAAYIGGCHATSNTLAGARYDIPVRGTHAHSWVSAFPSEKEAFFAYVDTMPQNSVLLVDTFDTLAGVDNAILAGKRLREKNIGVDLLGIRLDSGDLAALSIAARAKLDAAGFRHTDIVASNTLDEYVIADLKRQGALINVWGVGTNLVTAYDQPALDGVYKIAALRNEAGDWQPKLKLSEQNIKVSNPGRQQVRRFFASEQYIVDVIYDLDLGIPEIPEVVTHSAVPSKRLNDTDGFVDLLEPIFRAGKLVQPIKDIHAIREHAIAETKLFYDRYEERPYPVALEKEMAKLKEDLMIKVKG